MTGTASEATGELWRFYKLPVTRIPRHRPSQARELPARVFRTKVEKYAAIASDVSHRQASGQPVLIGCRTIRESEDLSAGLLRRGVTHTLLNAKTVSEEATIIADAGRPGGVTVATNMAGRGTHIDLAPESLRAGGLHVVATGLDGSRRIDRQLSGRAARQGQPGSSQVFLSGEDELLVELFPNVARKIARSRTRNPEGDLDGSGLLSCFFRAQRKVERLAYEERVGTFFYNELLNESKEKLS
jgi:preprotein translocase subunit SecA